MHALLFIDRRPKKILFVFSKGNKILRIALSVVLALILFLGVSVHFFLSSDIELTITEQEWCDEHKPHLTNEACAKFFAY